MNVSERAAALHADAIIWDQHACLPLEVDVHFDQVRRHANAGATFLSLNVGFGPDTSARTMPVLSAFRRHVLLHPDRYVLVATIDDVHAAKRDGRLAIAFDLEDSNPLDGRIELVQTYYDLGVRSMLMTYNGRNLGGHGCHDDPEGGLTDFGRAVVGEMNRVGMLVDASHCSYRTSMDLFEVSDAPVIFSHSNVRAIKDHDRNVTDEQLRACAATGGVVGINGIGIFLGDNDNRTETMVRHIDYAVDLLGPDHVGIGTDFVFDASDLEKELAEKPELFPESYRTVGSYRFVAPEQLPEVTDALLQRGYADDDVRKIMGTNFLRVAGQVWR